VLKEIISNDFREKHEKYAKTVFDLSLAVQEYEGIKQKKKYTDEEIAEKLGLTTSEITNIRCIAEIDFTPLEDWLGAEEYRYERRSKGGKEQID